MDHGASSYRRFLEGDEHAFEEIVKEYRDSLTFFIHRYVQDYATAEDITIDVFMEVLVHPHRYHFQVQLKTYLFMIGRSRALDYIKHRNKISFEEMSGDEEWVASEQSPEDQMVAEETRRMVNEAMKQLPEDMRVAVHLVYFEGLSYEETAQVMKKRTKQVDNLLFRAKAKLRTILGEEGATRI